MKSQCKNRKSERDFLLACIDSQPWQPPDAETASEAAIG
jgi:hypothetical protein